MWDMGRTGDLSPEDTVSSGMLYTTQVTLFKDHFIKLIILRFYIYFTNFDNN
jgi:hypothetical protein